MNLSWLNPFTSTEDNNSDTDEYESVVDKYPIDDAPIPPRFNEWESHDEWVVVEKEFYPDEVAKGGYADGKTYIEHESGEWWASLSFDNDNDYKRKEPLVGEGPAPQNRGG